MILFGIAELDPTDREYLLKNKYSCFIVQLLLAHLPQDQREKLAHILLEIEDEERSQRLLKELMIDANGSRSAEVLIRGCSEETVNSLFGTCVLPQLLEYSGNLRSNYVVQMFLARITDSSLVKSAFETLQDQLEVLYNSNNRGILLQMFNACRRTHTYEEACLNRVISILQNVLHLATEEERSMSVFIEKALAIEKEGGRVKINEPNAQYVLEAMLLDDPHCSVVCLPLLKLPVETLLRLFLSCSTGKRMVNVLIAKMSKEDQSVWKSVIVRMNWRSKCSPS